LEEVLGALGEAQARAEASCRAGSGEVGLAHRLQLADRRAARIRSLRSRAEPWRAEQRARAAAAEAAVTRARSALAQMEGARRAVDELLAKLRLEGARRVEGAEETETAAIGPGRSGPLSRASS
jgi:predicted phage gp36 major capsid-like protein